jgi:signal transduction histidine kinase
VTEALQHDYPEATDCSRPECAEVRSAYAKLNQLHQRTAKALASASHDFSTPLSILSGYVDLLQKGRLGPLSNKQIEVLGDIQASIARLTQLVQDFLIFSQFETGGNRINAEVGDIRACVDETCGYWQSRFQHQRVALHVLESGKVPAFPFDHRRVQRVLSNLLDNALRYAGEDGSVWINVDPIFWDRRNAQSKPMKGERRRGNVTTPNAVRISVTDTGYGISPEFHQDIFEDFVKLDETGGGVGLGLSIARRVVQAHGGKIWVESQAGVGCTFSFTLPYTPPQPARPRVDGGAK